MIETRTENVQLADGSALRVTVAEPENSVRGGLVVLHEAEGVTDAVHALVSSLAGEGWLTIAPHIYHGGDEHFEPHQANEKLQTLSGESVLADTDAACLWLADHGVTSDRTGLIGFDLGGAVAMVVAASRSLGAAVTVASGGIVKPLSEGLPSLIEIAPELACPWLGIYGDQDEDISVEEVEKLRDAASSSSVATDVVRFAAAGHRFDTDSDAAAEAWQRALNWLDVHLR
jgi:carboxymethylenebutenolidase